MPLWLVSIKAKVIGWVVAVGAFLGIAGLLYLKGRGDAKERAAEQKAAEALDVANARAEQAATHTTVVREVAAGVQALPSASDPWAAAHYEHDMHPTASAQVTANPPKLVDANPKSAAGRLAGLARESGK